MDQPSSSGDQKIPTSYEDPRTVVLASIDDRLREMAFHAYTLCILENTLNDSLGDHLGSDFPDFKNYVLTHNEPVKFIRALLFDSFAKNYDKDLKYYQEVLQNKTESMSRELKRSAELSNQKKVQESKVNTLERESEKPIWNPNIGLQAKTHFELDCDVATNKAKAFLKLETESVTFNLKAQKLFKETTDKYQKLVSSKKKELSPEEIRKSKIDFSQKFRKELLKFGTEFNYSVIKNENHPVSILLNACIYKKNLNLAVTLPKNWRGIFKETNA
jgi:hypothetical protein